VNMEKIRYSLKCFAIIILLAVLSMAGQEPQDSVFLYTGRVITGIIIEDKPGYTPDSYLKIQVAPNDVQLIHYKSIKLIKRSG